VRAVVVRIENQRDGGTGAVDGQHHSLAVDPQVESDPTQAGLVCEPGHDFLGDSIELVGFDRRERHIGRVTAACHLDPRRGLGLGRESPQRRGEGSSGHGHWRKASRQRAQPDDCFPQETRCRQQRT
jgi:hypothetical protein